MSRQTERADEQEVKSEKFYVVYLPYELVIRHTTYDAAMKEATASAKSGRRAYVLEAVAVVEPSSGVVSRSL